jgi:hypothetical protein
MYMGKKCPNCSSTKDCGDFHKNKRSKDGLACICKLCANQKRKEFYVLHPDYEITRKKKFYLNNKDRFHQTYLKKKKHILKRQLKYVNNKNKYDINFKLYNVLRNRIGMAIKNNYKSSSSVILLGCSIPELKIHLESQFKDGMTWDNHGIHGWHIDHIKPCSSFDLSKPEEQLKCFNYTNLQPLWAIENISKGGKNRN